jgi:hypothetical protein
MARDALTITHAEALRLIDEQLGERIYLALFVMRAGSQSGEEGPVPFIERTGRLGNPFRDRNPRLEDDIGYYGFGPEGVEAFPVPPLIGMTRLRDNGIDFLISDTVSIRIAWRGSKEVGDGPGTGRLGRLKILGVAREEGSATDDVSLDLRRFLADAKRAKAEIRSASPTDSSFETQAGERRRIWELKVRVMPPDEDAFEASAEVAWPLSKTVEERLERGESLNGVPAETQTLEVAFDQSNREEVMALTFGENADQQPPVFRGMILGRSSEPASTDPPF